MQRFGRHVAGADNQIGHSPLQDLTEDGRWVVDDIAARHKVSSDAVYTLLMAISARGGRQAQFNHPDLGGMGQWSQGGMIMVGDMFNQDLKYRVDQLCNELAAVLADRPLFARAPKSSPQRSHSRNMSLASGVSLFGAGASEGRWPAELGVPAAVGSQNDLHYAVFPGSRRLAISQAGRLTVYDTGDHQIGGVSQQQNGDQSLTFTSQHGLVRVADLKVITPESFDTAEPQPQPDEEKPTATDPMPPTESSPSGAQGPGHPAVSLLSASTQSDEIFSKLERLAELRKKDVITAEEFDAKKAELLARL